MIVIIVSSLHVASTHVEQFEECVKKRQTSATISTQNVKDRLSESLIYEFSWFSFMNLMFRLWAFSLSEWRLDAWHDFANMMFVIIMSSLHVASTHVEQFKECVEKRQTKITISTQKIEDRLNESLIYELSWFHLWIFLISFMSLLFRLRVFWLNEWRFDWTNTFECRIFMILYVVKSSQLNVLMRDCHTKLVVASLIFFC